MTCAACDHPDGGYVHTCAGSGTFRAAEAYTSDAVDEITAAWPAFDVEIHFRARALNEKMVRDKMLPLVTSMLDDDLVEHSNFTIKELAT